VKCIVCKHEMTTKVIGNSRFQLCVNCGGVWLATESLKHLSGLDLSSQRNLTCPSCKDTLSVRTLRGVEVDYCTKCDALWLDMGEMERISGIDPYVETGGGQTMSFKEELQKARNLEILKSTQSSGEADDVQIDDVFLSHVSGVVLAHATRRIKPQMDDDILMGMLVAIQDFVKDSFKDESDFLVERVDFGSKTLMISRGKHLVGAVLTSGGSNERVSEKLRAMIELSELRYRNALEAWKGSLDSVRGIKDILRNVFDLN